MIADPKYPVPFFAESTMPACAIMEANGVTTKNDIVCIKVRAYQAGPPPKVLLVNSPSSVNASTYGKATLATAGLVRAAGSVNAGSFCGPTHNSTSLTSGYPGFIAVGAGANTTTWVIRQEEPTMVRATTVNAVLANAASWTCDGVVAITGLCPVQGSGNTITITPMAAGWTLDADAIGLAVFDEAASLWRPVDFPCPN